MSLLSSILSKGFLPFLLRRDNRQAALKHYRFLQQSQYWSRDRLLDYQWQRFEALLRHGYEHSPYYRALMDERGLKPDSIKGLDDLSKLPILTRDMFYDRLDDFRCCTFEIDQLQRFGSGGSTGQRVFMYRNQDSYNFKLASAWRYENWMGRQLCDKLALVWPVHVDVVERGNLKSRLKNRYLLRQQMYYTGSSKASDMHDVYRRMREFKPEYLRVFPAVFYILSEYMRDNNLKLPWIKGITTTGEPLLDYMRKMFQEFYHCPVYDLYTTRESGNIACECSSGEGLHLAMETTIIEFVDGNRHVEYGQTGDILVTDLTNYALPLIRYRINDRGGPIREACSCGRGLALMSPTVGRDTDDFWATDGTRHSGLSVFVHVVDKGPMFGQMQVIQTALTEFHFRITNRPPPTDEHRDHIKRAMTNLFGPDIKITIEVVDSIPRVKSGKTMFSVCRIDPPASAKSVAGERQSP